MTRAFAILLRSLRLLICALMWASYAALLAPWITLAICVWTARKAVALRRTFTSLRFAFVRELRCPAGHRTSLVGIYECRGCGGLFAGYAFDRCPTCGESCGYVPCEHCGLAVRNPLI